MTTVQLAQTKLSPLSKRGFMMFAIMAALLAFVGIFQSVTVMLTLLNFCIISAIMSLGLNTQWGYVGLFNAGVMGSVAVGGVVVVLVTEQPVVPAIQAGGFEMLLAFVVLGLTIAAIIIAQRWIKHKLTRNLVIFALMILGYFWLRSYYDRATIAIEAINPSAQGFMGGLGLPFWVAWLIAPPVAALVAWLIGKISLGLRQDYFAIATLGISEIIVAIAKNEGWLTRGVNNVVGLDRSPIPSELNLQESPRFVEFSRSIMGAEAATDGGMMIMSSLVVKLSFTAVFLFVLLLLLYFAVKALHSPWGRMMRAMRDNPVAAKAMGKNVLFWQLFTFVLGSSILGLAGAMMTTLDGQFTPASYQPLRFTFLIWVMVIVGGSGNNLGSILGGFLMWFVWLQAEPAGQFLAQLSSSAFGDEAGLSRWLAENAAHFRYFVIGLVLLLTLRFSPKGILPEMPR